MINPGDNTIGAFGTLQGIYTPQLRMYFHNEKYGLMCDVIDLSFLGKTRDRKEALRRGKAWIKLSGSNLRIKAASDLIRKSNGGDGIKDLILGVLNPHNNPK